MKSKLDIRKFLAIVIVFCFFVAFKQDKQELKDKLLFSFAEKDNIPYPICEKDLEGKLIYVNKAFVELVFKPMGVEYKDMVGQNAQKMFGIKSDSIYRYHDSIVIKEMRPITFVESGRDTNGILHTLELTKYPVIIEGRVEAVGVIANYKF